MHTERLLRSLLGEDYAGLRVEVYDGTIVGDAAAETTARIVSPDFFRRVILGRASELAFGRAFVAGDVEIIGDIYGVLGLRDRVGKVPIDRTMLADTARVLGLGSVRDLVNLRPPPPPPEEIRIAGRVHTRTRDAASISSHYDVSNEFYELFLDSSMTYSCAVYNSPEDSLEQAQWNKYDLICRKLGLRHGMRLLDIGCGWGSMAIHAARNYGVDVVGITISREQQELAAKRVALAGLADHIEIRYQDYRDIDDDPFDAVSSIGMFEHVGERRLAEYFGQIHSLLVPGGRVLNHAINRSIEQAQARVDPRGFVGRFVFPDGELLETGQVVSAMNRSGLEVRHVDSFREHYALTLREWVKRLEERWTDAVRLTSPGRARVWRLYMAGSALGFETNEFNLTQILGVKSLGGGASAMPLRVDFGPGQPGPS